MESPKYQLYMVSKEKDYSPDYVRPWSVGLLGFENEIPTKEQGESIGFFKDAEHAKLYALDHKTGESILICEK